MRIKIGPYKNWFGPYQLAEKLCFFAKKQKDEYGIERVPDWVHNFGEWLAHGSIEREEEIKVGEITPFGRKKETPTLLYKFLLWIDSKKKRKQEIHIDYWDTWSMDHTLAPIILPMLKQLKETKHGSAIVDLEDVPENLRCTERQDYDAQRDLFEDIEHANWDYGYSLTEARWNWILDEMIFAFEMKCKDDWESEYDTGVMDLQSKKLEDGNYLMVDGPNHTYKRDYDTVMKIEERIQNGFRLFGKYFSNVWD